MLELINVTKIFNKGTPNEKIALNNVSLTLQDEDFVTIIGGNGAGKSTLMNVISGKMKPDSGRILIDGKDITNMSEHKRAKFFGRVFQDPLMGTAANMLIEENLSVASLRGKRRTLCFGISKKERAKYKELLKELDLGLEDRLKTEVGLLSGGQRQALTLLMASMNNPKLLLLDEHTAALDPKTSAKVLAITDKIVNENRLTTLMITHNMHDAIIHGNRLIMMNNGEIALDISGEEKRSLTVKSLLDRFDGVASDRMLL
ncbi:MAG: ABC transporter ATP-binding protein [Clostridiales bacterium]|nr:ABC transporter ATP-binding protein [Clostridiales bacterium]